MKRIDDYFWVGIAPDGALDAVSFNPVETPNEIARYKELGWKWLRFEWTKGIDHETS